MTIKVNGGRGKDASKILKERFPQEIIDDEYLKEKVFTKEGSSSIIQPHIPAFKINANQIQNLGFKIRNWDEIDAIY